MASIRMLSKENNNVLKVISFRGTEHDVSIEFTIYHCYYHESIGDITKYFEWLLKQVKYKKDDTFLQKEENKLLILEGFGIVHLNEESTIIDKLTKHNFILDLQNVYGLIRTSLFYFSPIIKHKFEQTITDEIRMICK